MKSKILLTITILFFIAFTSNAQIKKGKILLGGNFSYATTENPQASITSRNTVFNSGIQLGKFYKNIPLLV